MDDRLTLIHAPIWRSPRFAAAHAELTVPAGSPPVTTPTLRVTNPIPCSDPAGGVLRWLDLDVLIALNRWSWDSSCVCTLGHQDLLQTMGYNSSRRLPYRTTLASVRRLAAIRIELQKPVEASQNWEVGGPLLRHLEVHMTAGKRLLSLAVDPWWTFSLASWWTCDDERIYRAIGRADRTCGLARRLYLLLASLRTGDGTVVLPVQVLNECLAERHGPGKGSTLRFHDPCDPRSQLGNALGLLHRLGIWICDSVKGSRTSLLLQGRLLQPGTLLPEPLGRVRRACQVSIDPARWRPIPGSVDEEHVVIDPDDTFKSEC
jgi:hypothetical protein